MESILARALEYTLKYWLKSFSRDQFRLQGRTVQLSNLGQCGRLADFEASCPDGILKDVSPNGFKESFETLGGVDLEVRMVISEDTFDNETVNWMVENLKFSVKQPIEAIVTKDELQHLASLCQSEVDSMGRIAAGVLWLLKLEKSLGKNAIHKLSNLGTVGFDKIFSLDKLGRGSCAGSNVQSPLSRVTNEDQLSTVALLEEAV